MIQYRTKMGSKRDLRDLIDAANTLPLSGVERSWRVQKHVHSCVGFVRRGLLYWLISETQELNLQTRSCKEHLEKVNDS